MKRSILALSFAAAILAPAAASAATHTPEDFGMNLRHHLDIAERNVASGVTKLGLDRVVYTPDGDRCIGLVGENAYARCQSYGFVKNWLLLKDRPSVMQTKN